MSTCAYIDATAGVAGDMLMAALVDAGGSPRAAQEAVSGLGVAGLELTFRRVRRSGLSCLAADVQTPQHDRSSRPGGVVLALIADAPLRPNVKRCATSAFEYLIAAEAVAHGVPEADVHLHETGALDCIGDIVGVAALLDDLGLLQPDAQIVSTPLAAGSGTASTAHGTIPVPAPAVVNLVAGSALTLSFSGLEGERTTPTGAALLRAVCRPGPLPPIHVTSVGVGAGARDTPDRPNVTRLVVGEVDTRRESVDPDAVELIECTVDDLDPQFWPVVLDSVRRAGALDCWTTRITGRHGRPGEVVSALCPPSVREAVVEALFTQTGTFGVRSTVWQRETLTRNTRTIELGNGSHIGVKIGRRGGEVTAVKAEPAEMEELSRRTGIPVRKIRDEVIRAVRSDDDL